MADSKRESKTFVYYDAPPSRPAPIRQTGALAWIRNNLLKTPTDIFLTGLSIAIVAYVLVTFYQWTTQSANWWAIAFNIRQYMLGGFDQDLEWRVIFATVGVAGVAGIGIRIWLKHLSRLLALSAAVLLVILFGLPALVNAIVPLPPMYFMAGGAFSVGNVNDTPRPELAFLARAGEVITFSKANLPDDRALERIAGFMDRQLSSVRSTTADRFIAEAEQARLQDLLARNATEAIPLLTEAQAARTQAQLERLNVIPPVTETLLLNQADVEVNILDASTREALRPTAVLSSVGRAVSFTIPADGWYIFRKNTADGAQGMGILEVNGIYPILRTSVLKPGVGFVNNYVRMTDEYRTEAAIPRVGGQDMPFLVINEHQYRGERPLDAYLRVYLSPFVQRHAPNLGILILATVIGYGVGVLLERTRGKQDAQIIGAYAIISSTALIWVMAAGISVPELLNLSMVLGALAFIWTSGQIGARFGRTLVGAGLFLLGAGAVMAVPYLAFQPHYGFGILPVVNLFIVAPAFVAFWSGTASYGLADPATLRRDLTLGAVITLALLFVPLALALTALPPSASYTEWFLRHSDQRNWGGFLLTVILTIYGIVASFPIGVLLALGRKSDLPAVKYGCTLYIELVRGSPFITVLFFGQLLIPLINPSLADVPGTIRALVATIAFSAAYLAENVRGGLQALPHGQTEAGRALGLSGWQVTYYITLPQALRTVIPALVGQFISLFKDTSLVAIVGLIDLTGFVNSMVVQPEFTGTRREGLMFISIIYFVFSYVMSYISRLLERSGSGAVRRI
jgi:His/Glu/Gln/Arg/opine family amino acid ABC transporter permease subunit